MEIEKQYDEIARCNRCGFCQVACPIFRSTGHEGGVARGRIALLRALVEKRLPWDRQLEEPLFNCLLCGACTANCFPAVETADLILDARSQYLDRVGRGMLHKLLFDRVLPHPKRLRRVARAAALGKRSGLSKVARALGLLRIFGRDFPRAHEIVARFPNRAFRDRVTPGAVEGKGGGVRSSEFGVGSAEPWVSDANSRLPTPDSRLIRIGYFVGCGTDIMCPDAAEATLRLLRRMGKTVHVLENCCCGLPAATYGDRPAAQRLAEKNVALLAEDDLDVIVTDCSSCAAFLKKYPALFPEDDPRRGAAAALAAKVRDLVEILPSNGDVASPEHGENTVVTYHDPCHASRGQGLTREPREVLRSVAGLEYRELPEADWCCGGAGSYALTHYELSRKVLDRKMGHVEQTGANLLVTSCPACIVHLGYGVRKRGLPVRVCHISEVVSGRDPGT